MVQVNYIGHATVLIDIGRIRVLTDPLLRNRLFLLQRHGRSPVCDLLAQRSPDIVLLSHLHHDHADIPSLRRLPAKTPVIVPRGSGKYLSAKAGLEVHELVEGESVQVADVEITALPVDHASAAVARPSSTCLSYAMVNRLSVYFAGDTGPFEGMHEIGQEFSLDLALVPVWGYGHRLGPGHLTPLTAAQALRELRPRVAVPIHWGALRYPGPYALWKRADFLSSPPYAFADYAARVAPETDVRVLQPGTWTSID